MWFFETVISIFKYKYQLKNLYYFRNALNWPVIHKLNIWNKLLYYIQNVSFSE